jgi:hypothetical protein
MGYNDLYPRKNSPVPYERRLFRASGISIFCLLLIVSTFSYYNLTFNRQFHLAYQISLPFFEGLRGLASQAASLSVSTVMALELASIAMRCSEPNDEFP